MDITNSDRQALQRQIPDPELRTRLHARWRFLLTQGIVMIVLGLVAIALPVFMTLAVEVMLGWLLLAGGLWRAVHTVRSRAGPGFASSLVMAIAATLLGFMLLLMPLPGVLTLTMLLFALFIIDGVSKIALAFDLRNHTKEWPWPLMTGVLDLAFAALIITGWPSTAVWTVGLLVGLNMMFFGVAMTVIALAARRDRRSDLDKIVKPESYVPPQESRPAR
jgi:uncharacterized membrane protein HdeD (DUF308 family)